MDDKDRQLLGFLRKGLNLSARPFQEPASKLGVDSSEIFLRLIALRDIREAGLLTAVLDSRALAYQNVPAAAKLPEAEFEKAAARIHSHPGVNKSHRREHEFNFWFTLSLPPAENLQEHLDDLQRAAGCEILTLPAVKRFKAGNEAEANVPPGFIDLSNREIEILRKIQEDFPLVDRPFQKWARELGTTENDLLEILKKFSKQGILKRFALLFPAEERTARPQDLTAWQVPEEKQDVAAAYVSSLPGVASCVRRKAAKEFPYTLFVYHAAGVNTAETVLEIQKQIGLWPWANVPVAGELKNSRPFYFPEDLAAWKKSPDQILKEV